MGHHPHLFTLGCVTLRWFAGQNRPSCGISFLSFSECISQGEILWCCHRHNVRRLKRGKMWENEIQWILSYGLSNNISLCWDLNYCVRCGCGVTVSRPYHSGSMRGMRYFWGNTDWQAPPKSKLLECNDLLWIMQGRRWRRCLVSVHFTCFITTVSWQDINISYGQRTFLSCLSLKKIHIALKSACFLNMIEQQQTAGSPTL